MFQRQVPVVQGGNQVFGRRIERNGLQGQREDKATRHWEGNRKWISNSRSRAIDAILAIRIAERSRGRERTYLGAERRKVHHAIVDDSSYAGVVEDACSAAQARLAIAEYIPGKSDAW